MIANPSPHENVIAAPAASVGLETRFVNGMRLNGRHWLAVAAIVMVAALTIPWLWKKVERFETNADYRIPYALSRDYWLYERRLDRIAPTNIVVIGDSVIWGEYVRADGTLSHFLGEQIRQPGKFINAGVNGLFPLAFEGLIRDFGEPLSHRKVLLHCNVLWMSSPKADLQTEKEERFNHADLVPQFHPWIPCYKAELHHRLAAVIGRHFTLSQWANHLQMAYFDQKNILMWTLEDDGGPPAVYRNAYKDPLRQITLEVPAEPAVDPERGLGSARHRPWSTTGAGTARFEWVERDRSLQWAAFVRLLGVLQSRGDDVLVVVGPFNEHIMAEENRAGFRRLRDGIADWLEKHQVRHVMPATLPSALYADGSHPLTEGYRQLAFQLLNDQRFQEWVK